MSIVKWMDSKNIEYSYKKEEYMQQNYFNSVFPDATNKNQQIKNSNSDEEVDIQKEKKHFKIRLILIVVIKNII